jgi:hypothetical protein
MTRWFDLAPTGLDLFETAPFRYAYPMDLAVPASQVWAELTTERPLTWCRALSNGRYTSEPPYGVGTNRTVLALGLLRLRERFIRWDEQHHRKSFVAVQTSLPLFHRFGEDYQVEPAPTGCRFTWTFAFEPSALLKPTGPLAGFPATLLFSDLANDTRHHFGTP